MAREHFDLVKLTYGSNHPEYLKAESQVAELENELQETRSNIAARIATQYSQALSREQMLGKTLADTKAEWDSLNSRSFQYRQLKQEADADKALYDELVKKIQEADINAGFQDNNISIADAARPPLHPIYPNMSTNLLLAFFVSMVLAIGSAILLDSIDTTLRDPLEASRFLGVDVIGTMPIDRCRGSTTKAGCSSTDRVSSRQDRVQTPIAKGYYGTTSGFEEAVRTIRNTILLSDFEGRLRSIALTSAAPSEGKTTIAAHLGIANADRGKKTLLVDCDLRRPSLHSKFGFTPREGLSNVLTGELAWQNAVHPIEGKPNLSLLPAGPGSHRAADLVGPRLSSLLDEFNKEYDLVIIDSPPLLGFAECLQIATAADGVLIVSLAAETKRKAVAAVVSTLKKLRVNIIGVIMNQVGHNTSSGGYSYGILPLRIRLPLGIGVEPIAEVEDTESAFDRTWGRRPLPMARISCDSSSQTTGRHDSSAAPHLIENALLTTARLKSQHPPNRMSASSARAFTLFRQRARSTTSSAGFRCATAVAARQSSPVFTDCLKLTRAHASTRFSTAPTFGFPTESRRSGWLGCAAIAMLTARRAREIMHRVPQARITEGLQQLLLRRHGRDSRRALRKSRARLSRPQNRRRLFPALPPPYGVRRDRNR